MLRSPFPLFAMIAGFAAGGTLFAADWPQFRGRAGSGIAETSALPSEFGPEKNLVWKTALPPGHSSPVLTEDRIFLTAVEDEKLYTICLDRETGRILWRRQAPRGRREAFRDTHGPASPSPVTDGENVYVFFGDFGMLSYGGDGEERWRVPMGPFNNINGHGSSPILADGMVILLCDQDTDSYVIAFDQKDGSVRWKTDRPEVTRGYATPGVFRPKEGPAELIVPGSYILISYELATGKKLWWVRDAAWQLKCVPLIDGDTIYVSGWEINGDPGQQTETMSFDEALAAYDANKDGKIQREEAAASPYRRLKRDSSWAEFDLDKDGEMNGRDWTFFRSRLAPVNNIAAIRPAGRRGDLTDTAVLWRYYRALPNTPSPLLYEGVIYLVKDGGIFTTLDAKTGAMLKQNRLRQAIDKYWASPVAADGKVFLVNQACQVSVIRPGGQWEVETVNQLDGECFATPAIADGRIYWRTSEVLYSFGGDESAAPAAR